MTTMFDVQRGTTVEVAPEEAFEAFRSGMFTFPAGQRIPVVGPDGRTVTVDPSTFQRDVEERGYRPASAEELTEAEDEARYGDRSGTALAMGMADGVSLGGASVLAGATGLMDERALREIPNRNPGTYVTGEIGGMLLPAMLSGGTATAARVGQGVLARAARNPVLTAAMDVTPAGLMMRAGGAASRRAAGMVGRESATLGGRLVQRTVPVTTQGVTEGAIYGTGAMSREAALGDNPMAADEFIAGVGMHALYGGAGGALLGAGSSMARETFDATRRASRGTVQALERMWERTQGVPLAEGVADLVANTSARLVGPEHVSHIRRGISLTPEGRAARAVERAGPGQIDDIGREIRRVSTEEEAISGLMAEQARGTLKRNQVVGLIDTHSDVVSQYAHQYIDELRNVSRGLLQHSETASFGAKLGTFTDDVITEANNVYRQAARGTTVEGATVKFPRRAPLADPKTQAADLYIVLDRMKRRLGGFRTATSDTRITNGLDDLYDRLAAHLEDPRVYGAKLGQAQEEINAVWSPLITNTRQFRKRFMTGTGVKEGYREIWAPDSARIDTFLRKTGAAKNDSAMDIFNAHTTLRSQFNEVVAKHYDLGDNMKSLVARSRANASALRSSLKQVETVVKVLNDAKALRAAVGDASSLGIASLGYFVGGAPLAAAAGVVSRPDKMILAMSMIDRVNTAANKRIAKGVAQFVKRGATAAGRAAMATGKGARTLGRGAAYPLVSSAIDKKAKKPDYSNAAFEGRVDEILEVTSNPVLQTQRIGERLSHIQQVAPQTAATITHRAVRATNFLEQQIPPTARPRLGLNRHRRVPTSDVEMARFMRYVRAIDDPISILDDLSNSKVSREAVRAVKEVYPSLFDRMAAEVLEQVTSGDVEIDYQGRIQLGILFGVETDPSLNPRFLDLMRQRYAAAPESDSEAMNTPSARKAPDMSSGLQTASQDAASGVNG